MTLGIVPTIHSEESTAQQHAVQVSGSAHQSASGSAHSAIAIDIPTQEVAGAHTVICTGKGSAPVGLSEAQSPELQKLAQYDAVCGGDIVGRESFFAQTPQTVVEAQAYASDVVDTLKEYAAFGIRPLVYLEPQSEEGTLDLNKYKTGAYDQALDAYFAALKAGGVTNATMGLWVIFPEGNLPVWNNVDPKTFVANVTRTIQFQKKYFPESQSALMLDSESYPVGGSWGDGYYASLLPFVTGIPKGLVDSFGLQGFPWSPTHGQSGAVLNPKVYLRADFAAEAAKYLGVHSVWFNTGTFRAAYTQSSSDQVLVSPAARQTMLDGVIGQATWLQSQGFSVAVHLFAEDKSTTSEAIDWSYWHGQPTATPEVMVFKTFVGELQAAGMQLWLFDTDSH